jgi:hypothetical protein
MGLAPNPFWWLLPLAVATVLAPVAVALAPATAAAVRTGRPRARPGAAAGALLALAPLPFGDPLLAALLLPPAAVLGGALAAGRDLHPSRPAPQPGPPAPAPHRQDRDRYANLSPAARTIARTADAERAWASSAHRGLPPETPRP